MAIVQLPTPVLGNTGTIPNIKTMCTTDSLSTITTAGYLNQYNLTGFPVGKDDFLNIKYSYNTVTQAGIVGWFTVSITNGVITLVEDTSTSSVTYTSPSVANHIAVWSNTSGNLTNDVSPAINLGDIQAGQSGTAGGFVSFSSTLNRGALVLQAVANTGNTNTFIANAPMGQTTTVSIPDPGASTANFLLNTGANTMAAGSTIVFAKTNGTEAANAVTTNGQTGVITTSALTTAGGASYAITWTNSAITTGSVINLSLMGGTNTVKNITLQATAGAGTSTLTIYNNTAATALNGTVLIGFRIS